MLSVLVAEIDFEKDLRWLLVSTLYALAIAEIAVQSAKLVAHNKRSRSDTSAVTAHLILVTFVVTTSWVGWTMAVGKEVHPEHHLTNVFSWSYCLLLVDVGLLIFYFVMAKRAGIPESGNEALTPSAKNASFWLVMVFGGYVLWDLIARLIMHGLSEFQAIAWPTVVCFVLAIISWRYVRLVTTHAAMVVADAGMIALILLFRALKAVAVMGLSQQRADLDTNGAGWERVYWAVVVTQGGLNKVYWMIAGTLGVLLIACLCVATVLDQQGK
jgi:hypothetical protein